MTDLDAGRVAASPPRELPVPQSSSERNALVRLVGQSLDALAPLGARLISDASVSAEHAMHVVVMDPAADAARTRFDDAIRCERSLGDPVAIHLFEAATAVLRSSDAEIRQ